MKKLFWLNIALVVLTFIGITIAYPYMPEKIPTNWNMYGVVNANGSRATLFLMPSIAAFLTVLIYFLPKIDPRGKNVKLSGKAIMIITLAFNLFIVAITVFLTHAALGYETAMDKIVSVLVGGLFIALGFCLPKVKPNYFIGIRTPWTLENETVWAKTHNIGGRVFIISGLVFVLSIIFPAPVNFAVPLTVVLAGTFGAAIYSFILYKKRDN